MSLNDSSGIDESILLILSKKKADKPPF